MKLSEFIIFIRVKSYDEQTAENHRISIYLRQYDEKIERLVRY